MPHWRVVALIVLYALVYPAAAADAGSGNFKLIALSGNADTDCNGPDCVAVLLIHGLYGTETNDAPERRCDLNAPAADDCSWGPLISHLRKQQPLWKKIRIYIFRYMSSNGYSTMGIGRALREKVESPPDNCSDCCVDCPALARARFIIVAHSLGGIVARQFMNSRTDTDPKRGADLISGVITLATPHHGTPLANRLLRDSRVRRKAGTSPVPKWECAESSLLKLKYPQILTLPLLDPWDPACTFDLADWGYWSWMNSSPDLERSAEQPNRSDLLWDEHDDFFAVDRQRVPSPQEVNADLLHLTADARQWPDDSRKLIVYGSSVATEDAPGIYDALQSGLSKHYWLKAFAALSANGLHLYLSDGLVPLASAMKEGDSSVNLRREDLYDYDHLDMRGNPKNDEHVSKNLPLFNRVTADIDALVRFGTIPPQLLRLDTSAASAAAGTSATLTYRIRNGNREATPVTLKAVAISSGDKTACQFWKATALPPDKEHPSGDFPVTKVMQLPADFPPGNVQIVGEVLPADEGQPCEASLLPSGSLPLGNSTSLSLFVPPAFTTNPTISIALAKPDKQDYRIGETVQLKMTTTAGKSPFQTGGETTSATLLQPPSVSVFLWVTRPDGSIRYYYLDSANSLRESTLPTPITTPAPVIDYTWELLTLTVDPSTMAGAYTWNAAISRSDVSAVGDQLASAKPLSYRVLHERAPDPSVVAINTPILVYEPGDQMVINYSTRSGATSAKYDLMLRLTSRGRGSNYYFYDNANDTNRWIHTSARPMQTIVPQDGDGQIPTAGMDAIQIADDTPSGTFDMKAYFSLPGKNTQVGESASCTFVLDTPAAPNQCFIATAAFGSPLNGSVVMLRNFRDRILLAGWLGSSLVHLYYRYSPPLAAAIRVHPFARKIVRTMLWPVVMVSSLWLAAGFPVALATCIAVFGMIVWLLRRFRRPTLIALALAIGAGVLSAAEIRGSIVRSQPFPAPVVGATVTIANTPLQTASGTDGTFRFQNLQTGTYELQVVVPGYQNATAQAILNSASSVQNFVLAVTPTGARTYEYYLPHTAEGAGWWTFFAVTNAGYTGADVMFAAFDAGGQYLGTSTKLVRIGINQQFAGSPSSFFASGMDAKAAWYKITSTAPLSGIEMFGSTGGTLAAFPLTTASSQSLFLPHVAVDSEWWTGISFVSGWVRAANVSMEARDGVGTILASASRLGVLKPGEKTVDQLQNYFGWDYPRGSQWVGIRSDGPITGFELFGTQDFQMMAAVPAAGRGARRLFFPHVGTSSGWWTGVAMLNVGSTAANVKLTAYGMDGSKLAAGSPLSLSPGQRTVNQLQNYFDQWPSNVKYVDLSSDSDLIAFELVGNWELRSMSGMTAFTTTGTELSFPFIESDADWETTLQVANVSSGSAQITLDAYDGSGARLGEVSVGIPAHAAREGTVKTLFGQTLPNTRSVRVRSNGGGLAGYSSLARVKGSGFADFPAQVMLQDSSVGTSTSAASVVANMSRVIDALRFDPDPAGGVRVMWSSDVSAEVRRLAGDQVRSGDVIISVDGIAVNSLHDLRIAYRLNRARAIAPVQVRRNSGRKVTIQVRNPARAPDARVR